MREIGIIVVQGLEIPTHPFQDEADSVEVVFCFIGIKAARVNHHRDKLEYCQVMYEIALPAIIVPEAFSNLVDSFGEFF
jgi:hypothetical protein